MAVDLTGLADKSENEVRSLWQKARGELDKAAEYIIRDHFVQQFGGDITAEPVTAEPPAAEPAAEPVTADPEPAPVTEG